jgi:hypothetical protein
VIVNRYCDAISGTSAVYCGRGLSRQVDDMDLVLLLVLILDRNRVEFGGSDTKV